MLSGIPIGRVEFVVFDGPINRGPLQQQVLDARKRVMGVGRQHRAALQITADASQDRLRRGGEPHHRPDHFEKTDVLFAQRRPAARGDNDRAVLARQTHEHGGFHLTETVFAILREDVCDVFAGVLLDLGVRVDITRAETLRERMADRTLTRTHKPNQDDIH